MSQPFSQGANSPSGTQPPAHGGPLSDSTDHRFFAGPGDALANKDAAEVDLLKSVYKFMADKPHPQSVVNPDVAALAAAACGCLIAEPASILAMSKATDLYIKRLLENLSHRELIMASSDDPSTTTPTSSAPKSKD